MANAWITTSSPNVEAMVNSIAARFPEGKISGDIDLMLVTPERYHIVEFKTNDTTQRSVDELAEKY